LTEILLKVALSRITLSLNIMIIQIFFRIQQLCVHLVSNTKLVLSHVHRPVRTLGMNQTHGANVLTVLKVVSVQMEWSKMVCMLC